VVSRELLDVVRIFKTFQNKHEVSDELVFTRRLELYLVALNLTLAKS
jgi:hypothetical protein